ncbi:hypothetical protein LCGC14_1248890 [marine sediment metagenome]|uniref:Uncharacterized protein n=1 Tax=marine sediment metagenome TaxID=412755 RepID=A0A0F9P7M9_9ZZZZ
MKLLNRFFSKVSMDHEYAIKTAAMRGYYGGLRDSTNERYGVIRKGERPWLDANVHNVIGVEHLIGDLPLNEQGAT